MLHLQIANDRTNFSPGDEIAGSARWQCAEAPERIEIHLCWTTRGKGTPDSGIATTVAVESPVAQGEHAFRFIAPGEPHSFSGKLISLVWMIEAVTSEDDENANVEIVIAPEGREIELPQLDESNFPQAAQAASLLDKFLPRRQA